MPDLIFLRNKKLIVGKRALTKDFYGTKQSMQLEARLSALNLKTFTEFPVMSLDNVMKNEETDEESTS